MEKQRGLLRGDTRRWGMIGHALSLAQDDAVLADWMHDWSARADAEPWMLLNLALGLRGLERTDEAAQVSRHAVQLKPDYTVPYHQAWLALDAAFAGDREAVEDFLDEGAKLDAYHQLIAAMAEAILIARDGAANAFAEARGLWPRRRRGANLSATTRRCTKPIAARFEPSRASAAELERRSGAGGAD